MSIDWNVGDSYVWKGSIVARDEIVQGLRFRIDQGENSIWFNNWSHSRFICNQVPFIHFTETDLCLKYLIQHDL